MTSKILNESPERADAASARLMEAVRAYLERFNEGPPIFGIEPEDAVRHIQAALDNGEPMKTGAESEIPPDALL